MGGRDRFTNLDPETQHLGDRHRAHPVQPLAQLFSIEPLHHHVRDLVFPYEVDHVDDARVADRGSCPRLTDQPRRGSLIGDQLRQQRLDRHRPLQLQVLTLIHGAHPAAADQRTQAIAPAPDQLASPFLLFCARRLRHEYNDARPASCPMGGRDGILIAHRAIAVLRRQPDGPQSGRKASGSIPSRVAQR